MKRAILAALLATFIFAAPAMAGYSSGGASCTVTPVSSPLGGTITISASGFSKNHEEWVYVYFANSVYPTDTLYPVYTDNRGDLALTDTARASGPGWVHIHPDYGDRPYNDAGCSFTVQ